jgi:hypothetical protein
VVTAFEPASDSAARLRAAATANRLDLTVVEAALGAGPGAADLLADPDYDPADAGSVPLHGTGTLVQSVSVTIFDSWAAEHRVARLDLVKLDVEGAELAASGAWPARWPACAPAPWWSRSSSGSSTAPASTATRFASCSPDSANESSGQVLPVGNEVYRRRDNG